MKWLLGKKEKKALLITTDRGSHVNRDARRKEAVVFKITNKKKLNKKNLEHRGSHVNRDARREEAVVFKNEPINCSWNVSILCVLVEYKYV